MFESLPALIAISLAMLVWAFAFWKGELPERTICLAMVAAWIASPFFSERNNLEDPSFGVLVVDIALFVVIAAVSVSSRRLWTALAAGFQLVNVLLHVAMIIDLNISVYTYRLGLAVWSVMALLALLFGTVGVMRQATPKDLRDDLA